MSARDRQAALERGFRLHFGRDLPNVPMRTREHRNYVRKFFQAWDDIASLDPSAPAAIAEPSTGWTTK